MKRIIPLLLFSLITISCATTSKTNSNTSDYWSKVPDLSKVVYAGGDGKTIENAIIIKNAGNERSGVAAEYAFITKIYGVKFEAWKPAGQSTIIKDNKKIDLINIQTIPSNETISFYFDITEFYGKFN
jgi:hypothetical protein